MPPIHSNTRDRALRRLNRANRWLIAGSLTLMGVFSEVAANAFPGRKLKSTQAHTGNQRSGSTEALKAPSEAPRSSTTPEVAPSQEAPPAAQSDESSPSQESTPSQKSTPPAEQEPKEESAPAKEEPAPAPTPEPAPVHESAPPVVSGGS